MNISANDIRKLADLSSMHLTDEEVERFQLQLSSLFETIDHLNELDLSQVPETAEVTGVESRMREDEANYTFEKSDMVATMPDVDDAGYLRVKAVFTDESALNAAENETAAQARAVEKSAAESESNE